MLLEGEEDEDHVIKKMKLTHLVKMLLKGVLYIIDLLAP